MGTNSEQAINILKAWHQVEFFQIYSIPEPDKDKGELDPVQLYFQDLSRTGDQCLPWLSPRAFRQCGLDPEKATRYTLYLGLFDKAVMEKMVDECRLTENHLPADEIEQRLDLEGVTCFAKLKLDQQGAPDFESFSVSTLPWALGYLQRGEVRDMTLAKFDECCERLTSAIERIQIQDEYAGVIDTKSLLMLIQQLYQWAEMSTEQLKLHSDDSVILCQIGFQQYIPEKIADNSKNKHSEKETAVQEEPKEGAGTEENEAEETEPTLTESAMPILNSFYIRDLERAINSIRAGTAGPGLLDYLGEPKTRACDLYTDEALPLIRQILQPANTSAGRWPGNPQHDMSLMQQFAINATLTSLGTDGGIISVNGPPGTGKTTLLKDIVAHNVVERAKVLAKLNFAGEGIDKDGLLIESLTGFEMVVASSNNAAVENISRELPQMKAIWEGYAQGCSFFRPVANLMAAKRTKAKKYKSLEDASEASWGMISAVMGAKAKRKDFKDRLFFHKYYHCDYADIPRNRAPEVDLLNFWQYQSITPKISFLQAKQNFCQALNEFESLNRELVEFERLLSSDQDELYCRQIEQKQQVLRQIKQSTIQIEDYLEAEIIHEQLAGSEVKQNQHLIQQQKAEPPGFFTRIFRRSEVRSYRSKLIVLELLCEQIQQKRIQHQANVLSFQRQLKALNSQYAGEESSLSELIAAQEQFRNEIEQYRQRLKNCSLPKDNISITDPKLQQHAYWQSEELNHLRSKVFIEAIKLHEVWVRDAQKINSFHKRISLLSDCILGNLRDGPVTELWQIVFMFVPVISTTFASMGRMFTSIPESTFGWLMIDEAGQAVPQAAVGGVLRCKNTIVVGDPWQIKPVFTAPPALVNYLTTSELGYEQEKWTPLTQSVQTLADRVNRYGCDLNSEWIGIPLWVHRRCINPMFDISNEIAYQGRMIHGNYTSNENVPTQLHPQLFENRWIETSDRCSKKQFTPQIGEETIVLLTELLQSQGNLSDVYIISPFKAVKNEVKYFIENSDRFMQLAKKEKVKISDFLKKNIGTVHTFQGKENGTVIFVLGCDMDNQGGAGWAASEPNLLNVAVTRAKKNLFIIGNSQIWAKQPFFDVSYRELMTVEREVAEAH